MCPYTVLAAQTPLTPSEGTYREISFVAFTVLKGSACNLCFRTNICRQCCHVLLVATFKAPLSPSRVLVCRLLVYSNGRQLE